MSNSENRIISNQMFYGGQSSDEAIGTEASFSYTRAMEHRRNPSQLTVLPGPRKISQGVAVDLILNIVQTQTGLRYAYGENGNIYKIDATNKMTFLNKLPSGSDGCSYRSDSDAIYFATQSDVRRLYPISGANPTIDQIYGPSKSIDTAAYRTGGGLECSVPTAINELNKCTFQSDIEPFYSIKVNIKTLGAGDLTLKLHDGLDNEMASVTILRANLVTGLNEFVFPGQVRALVKPNARTYHWHLTSTQTGTTVACSTVDTFNTADYEIWAYRLVDTVNNFHPMEQFLQYTLIGNGNYLAVWEPLSPSDPPNNEFQRHRLVFPSGFEVCGIAVTDEFAVIACEKYASDGTKDFQEGKLFIWDGTAQTYNQIIDVSGGSPSAIQSHENYPYFFVNGDLCAWPGGKNIVKIRKIPNTNLPYTDVLDNSRVYPNMMTIRDNLLHAAYPSITNNTLVEYGIYMWGTLEKNYPSSFNYGYVNSSQKNTNTSGNLRQGCIRNFGDEMYMSMQYDDGTYGLEIVDNFCDPAPIFKYRARRFDAGASYRTKHALKIGIDMAPMPANTSITPVHKIDNGSETIMSEFVTKTGDTEKKAVITKQKFKRIVIGFDGTCDTGANTPTIYTNTLEWNPLMERRAI